MNIKTAYLCYFTPVLNTVSGLCLRARKGIWWPLVGTVSGRLFCTNTVHTSTVCITVWEQLVYTVKFLHTHSPGSWGCWPAGWRGPTERGCALPPYQESPALSPLSPQ